MVIPLEDGDPILFKRSSITKTETGLVNRPEIPIQTVVTREKILNKENSGLNPWQAWPRGCCT